MDFQCLMVAEVLYDLCGGTGDRYAGSTMSIKTDRGLEICVGLLSAH